jgi:hypothetical protein
MDNLAVIHSRHTLNLLRVLLWLIRLLIQRQQLLHTVHHVECVSLEVEAAVRTLQVVINLLVVPLEGVGLLK